WTDNGTGTQVPDAASVAYVHTNHLGTTRLTSDAASPPQAQGAVVYTAFGERICAVAGGCDASDPNPRYGYVGAWGYQTATSDAPDDPYATSFPYLHVGARYYDPATGRFLQRDPIGILGGLNVYAYVWSSPSNRVDPTGSLGIYDGIYVYGALRRYNPQGCPWSAPNSNGGFCRQSSLYGFHGGASSCYREINPGGGHSCAQCCYDSDEALIPSDGRGAGTADTVGPATGSNPDGTCSHGFWETMGHVLTDVLGAGSGAKGPG
ncbi:MAG: RHS repeat-associated core domain-containing protein, partial [Phycisphaerae bacterium]